MEKEPGSPQDEGPPPPGEASPPFNPDPDIVTFLERGTTCVGVPKYASATGGPPGVPTAIR